MTVTRARRVPDWSCLPPPHPALRISVVVPVRNEARRLPAALRALAHQRVLDGTPLPRECYEVIVLANNCSDASAEVVQRCAARHAGLALHVVEVRFVATHAHVGNARACLMNLACRRLMKTAGHRGVIASTDGDTRVAADWLAATLEEIDAGADAVGGRIVAGGDVALPGGLIGLTRRDALYQRLRVQLEHIVDPDEADPWPRHHQHFGASLAVTAAAYAQAGGMPVTPFLEDEALYRRLRQHDLKIRHSERVSVVTSSRRRGRVEIGLSWQLRVWQACDEAGEDARVPCPFALCEALALRRRLRRLWLQRGARLTTGRTAMPAGEAKALEAIAERLIIGATRLQREWRRAETFGALWAEVEPRIKPLSKRPAHTAGVPMREAIASLRTLIARHVGRQRARTNRAGTLRDAAPADGAARRSARSAG